MCGIIGYLGRRQAAPIVYQGLKMLEYRGYDSYGVATVDGRLNVKKEVGAIGEACDIELSGRIGIGHTRWATHGKVTRENAHPHLDCQGEIAVVHNGIISNYAELREELMRKGHRFRSETDTECLAHLIEDEYNGSLGRAVRRALGRVKGTYAIGVLSSREDGKLVGARSESPLVLGIGEGETFLASDITAFVNYTTKALPLEDGEYATITREGFTIREISSGVEVSRDVLEVEWSDEMARREGYSHFMLKEIYEQPRAIKSALNIYPEDIRRLAEMMEEAETVYMLGAGTSLHAAMVAEYWFSSLCDKLVIAMDSSEFQLKGVVDRDTLVIAVTQSGETYDTLAAMRYARAKGARTAAIINVIGSTATRMADHVILQGSGIEISVCATKTFTSQLTILLRTALELARLRGKDTSVERELQRCPGYVEAALTLAEEVKRIADRHFTVENYIYIGKGINLPTALEGALKFKEITYHHAEGMSGGMLKHGTISLIDGYLHTVALAPMERPSRSRIASNIQEVKARGGKVIGIASARPLGQCDANIVLPEFPEIVSPIVFAPVCQLLAYFVAVRLGRDVDKPRALAKSVTVE
jgi:glucosamine--fructose-6-phosphate aminotransferase (isomerizing)